MAKWNLFRGFNPATAVDWKGADANMRRALTLDEVIRLLEELKRTHIDTYRKACFAVYAGLRKGEIHRLTVGDINLEINQLRVRDVKDPNAKGRVRELFFPPQLRAVIEEIYAERQLGDNDLLFETSFQDRVWLRVVNRLRFNDNREPMDRLTFHGLRHTYAALLGASSGSPLAVQKQLGHSDIQKSMMYTRLDPEVAVPAVQLLGEKFAQREAELKVNKLPRRKKRGIKDLS
jgi:integrase